MNFGSTPSLKTSRISLGEATVPPTRGVELSSWAWAKADDAAQREGERRGDFQELGMNVLALGQIPGAMPRPWGKIGWSILPGMSSR